MKSIAVPVELESAGTPAVVEREVAVMPSVPDLEAGAALASIELEVTAEAACAFDLETAPFNRTGTASPNSDASPLGRNVRGPSSLKSTDWH